VIPQHDLRLVSFLPTAVCVLLVILALLCAPPASRAENCELAREQIEDARILANSGNQARWAEAEIALEKAYKLCMRNPAVLDSIAAVYDLLGRRKKADGFRQAANLLRGGSQQSSGNPTQPQPRPQPPDDPAAKSQPTIELIEPTAEMLRMASNPGMKEIFVRGRARHPMGVFSVRISGKEANLLAIDSQTVEFSLDKVLLHPGRNEIAIVATSTSRTEGRLSFSVERAESERVEAGQIPDRWALVVGISKYGPNAKGISNLKYARRDAEAFYEFLRSNEGGAFPKDHILLLTDEEATSNNLRYGVRDFLGKAGENDLAMIFIAAHGSPDPAKPSVLYLLTYDVDLQRIGATAFDMEEIQLALRKTISARRVVALVDSCHSGGVGAVVGNRSAINPFEQVNRYLQQLANSRPGTLLFAASQTNEPSYEDERWGGGHGVFTHFLLKGLQGAADRDGDGVVRLQELIDYVSERVKRETDYKQHPIATNSAMWEPNLPLAILSKR
jgi:hypothetical protein